MQYKLILLRLERLVHWSGIMIIIISSVSLLGISPDGPQYVFLFWLFLSRAAKRKTDDKSFYGGVLHVCYAPEYETIEEVRSKLKDRQQAYCRRLRQIGMCVDDGLRERKRKMSVHMFGEKEGGWLWKKVNKQENTHTLTHTYTHTRTHTHTHFFRSFF